MGDRGHAARIILDQMSQFNALLDIDGRVLEINRAALDRGGLEREDVLGRPFWEAGWWRTGREATDWFRSAILRSAAGEGVHGHVKMGDATGIGEADRIDFRLAPVRDDAGRVEYVLVEGRALARDEAGRVTEEALRARDRLGAGQGDGGPGLDPRGQAGGPRGESSRGPSMKPIRVLLADDHTLVRAGLRALLGNLPAMEVVGEASSGEEALILVESLRPDILLCDISMPGLSGLEVAERVARDFPETRTVILSIHGEKPYAIRALQAGAVGYLLKDAGTAELELALRATADGGFYLSPAISRHIVADYLDMASTRAEGTDPLTARQREVLKLIAAGLTTKAIARRLDISVKTADAHRAQLMERLGIHDIASLVRYAIKIGLVQADE
jgi:DNA-binding NarL/FixJ family response regulator